MTTVYNYCDRDELEIDDPCVATVMEMAKVVLRVNLVDRLDSCGAYVPTIANYEELFEAAWEQFRTNVLTQMLDDVPCFEFGPADILLYVSYGVFRHLPGILDELIPPRPSK